MLVKTYSRIVRENQVKGNRLPSAIRLRAGIWKFEHQPAFNTKRSQSPAITLRLVRNYITIDTIVSTIYCSRRYFFYCLNDTKTNQCTLTFSNIFYHHLYFLGMQSHVTSLTAIGQTLEQLLAKIIIFFHST